MHELCRVLKRGLYEVVLGLLEGCLEESFEGVPGFLQGFHRLLSLYRLFLPLFFLFLYRVEGSILVLALFLYKGLQFGVSALGRGVQCLRHFTRRIVIMTSIMFFGC